MNDKDRIKELEIKLDKALEVLNDIASWNDGDEVDDEFDNPADARKAREAIEWITQFEHTSASSQGEPGKSSPKPTKSDSLE